MTTLSIEELKKMADELGYKLVKKQQPLPKLLPCKCGCTRREIWLTVSGKSYHCPQCGLAGQPGTTQREQRENWNAAVERS